MARSKKRELTKETMVDALVEAHQQHDHPPPLEQNPPPPPQIAMLKNLREESIQTRKDTANTIADLEEWRAEIDATIALLRAR